MSTTTTPKTTAEMLAEVQQAISCLISGSESVTVDGISYRKSSLDSLQKRETELIRRMSKTAIRGRSVPNFS